MIYLKPNEKLIFLLFKSTFLTEEGERTVIQIVIFNREELRSNFLAVLEYCSLIPLFRKQVSRKHSNYLPFLFSLTHLSQIDSQNLS